MKNTMKNSGKQKDNEIELKDEKNKIKACDDLDVSSDEMAKDIWTPEKKIWKHLELEIYSSWTNSEGRDYSLGWNKNKIYCMLILHRIKLMTSNGFCILLILLEKGLTSDISQTWEGLHEPPVGMERANELILQTRKIILNEPP